MTHFNTTHLIGTELRFAEIQALSQEDRVRHYFLRHKKDRVSGYEITEVVFEEGTVPESTGGKICCGLVYEGLIFKTKHFKDSKYKSKCYLFQYNKRFQKMKRREKRIYLSLNKKQKREFNWYKLSKSLEIAKRQIIKNEIMAEEMPRFEKRIDKKLLKIKM